MVRYFCNLLWPTRATWLSSILCWHVQNYSHQLGRLGHPSQCVLKYQTPSQIFRQIIPTKINISISQVARFQDTSYETGQLRFYTLDTSMQAIRPKTKFSYKKVPNVGGCVIKTVFGSVRLSAGFGDRSGRVFQLIFDLFGNCI